MKQEMISVHMVYGDLHDFTGNDVDDIFSDLWCYGEFRTLYSPPKTTEETTEKAYEILGKHKNIRSGNYAEIYFIEHTTFNYERDCVEEDWFDMVLELYDDNGAKIWEDK